MENFVAYNPVKVHFGKGVVRELGEQAALTGKHALLVYGKGSVLRNGSYNDTVSELKNAGIAISEFSGIRPNPTIEEVDAATELGLEKGVDMVVAVGGGSVIDSAKIMAVCISERCPAWEVMKRMRNPEGALPIIAVLTLAATGTEMNSIAVLQNNKTMEKFGYSHPDMFPRHSFMDPTYTRSVPPDYTSYGVIDLMAHALEPFFGAGDASLSDRFVEAIIREAMLYGPQLMKNLEDYTLRARIMWAATCALNGMTSFGRRNGDFTSHALGHVLSLLYDTAHGATLSIAMPAWMKHMMPRIGNRISRLGQHIFDDPDADLAISRLENFFREMGSPVRCQEIGLNESHKPEILALMNKNKSNGKNPDNFLEDEDRLSIVENMFAE
jgi:alcohol dehydrogenase YqhD (iron-dependent ADH family)